MKNEEIFSKFGDTNITIRCIDKGVVWFSTPANDLSIYLRLKPEEFLTATFYSIDTHKSTPENQKRYFYTLNDLYELGYSIKNIEIFYNGKVIKEFN